MKRLFWLGVGIAVGAIVVRQVTRAAHAYTPSGLADTARNSAAGLWESVQDFIADVRDGMAEREDQIHAAFVQGVSLNDLDAEEYDEDQEYGGYGDDGGPDHKGADREWPGNNENTGARK